MIPNYEQVSTYNKYYGDIADAIRTKLDVETRYFPSEMAQAILSIGIPPQVFVYSEFDYNEWVSTIDFETLVVANASGTVIFVNSQFDFYNFDISFQSEASGSLQDLASYNFQSSALGEVI